LQRRAALKQNAVAAACRGSCSIDRKAYINDAEGDHCGGFRSVI
jgi:hypothetical protein